MHRLFISDANLWRSKIWRSTLSFAVPPNIISQSPPVAPPPDKHKLTQSLYYYTVVAAQGFIYTGLLIFRGKKAKFRGIFRGKFAEKSADFVGFSREKSQNSRHNRPISGDFSGKKSIFEGFSGANS